MSRHPVLVRVGSGDFYQNKIMRFDPAIQVARDGRLGDRLITADYTNFAPRLGIAWSPTSKWTVRTGAGILYVAVGFVWLSFTDDGTMDEEAEARRDDHLYGYQLAAMLCFLIFADNLLRRI